MHGGTTLRRFLRSTRPPIELDEFRHAFRRTRRLTGLLAIPSLFVLAARIEHAETVVPILVGLAVASLLHTQVRSDAALLEMSIVDTAVYVLMSLILDVPEAVMMVVVAEACIVFLFVPARTAILTTIAYMCTGLVTAAFSVNLELQHRDASEVVLVIALFASIAALPTLWALLSAGAEMHRSSEHEHYLQLEQKHLSAEREKVVEELRATLADLSRAQTDLLNAQKLEAIGSLAAGIAHEINTPIQYVGDNTRFASESVGSLLAIAESAASLCERMPEEDPLVEACRAALEAADIGFMAEELPDALGESLDGIDQVARIVQALKSFSHPGSPDRAPTDINELITTTATVCRNEWKYVATVDLDGLDPDLQQVPVLAGPLKQVILNLIVNAAHAIEPVHKASGEKGTISIRTFIDGSNAILEIGDTGTGIPEDIRDRILDPFFTTKDVGTGSGQGLAIANSIVGNHNGTLTFQTETGVGTTFRIVLPLKTAPAVEPAGV